MPIGKPRRTIAIVRWPSYRHQWPNRWKRRNLPVARGHRDQRAAHRQPGQRAPEAAAHQTQRGKPQAAEDQRPAEQRVDGDSRNAQPQDDARPLERRDEIAEQLEQKPGRGAPHVGAQEGLALARQLLRDAECAHQGADVPQQQPVGRKREDQQPQAGAEGSPHVANRIEPLSERGRHHRRRGDEQPEQQQVEGEGEVERQRRRGELGRAEPAHEQDVGRLDQLLRKVGEDQRPGERESRANLGAPFAARFPRLKCSPAESTALAGSCMDARRKGLAPRPLVG